MPMRDWIRFGRGKDKEIASPPAPAGISEAEAIGVETNQPSYRWTNKLKALLVRALEVFGLSDEGMAEALICTPGTRQLIASEIQPETSVALISRIRSGNSVVWRAYASGTPVIAAIEERNPRSRAMDTSEQTTLFSTRSVLAYPLRSDNDIIGVLNIESSKENAFPADAIARLQHSGIAQELHNEMRTIRFEPMSEQAIVEDLLTKMRARIAFAIAQDDLTETCYQILRVAASVVGPTQVSGGLILVRREEHNLSGSERKLFAVRAGRIGSFNSEPEWEWKQGDSIAWRIYANQQGEVIDHAQEDKDYRDSGTTLGETSELIVPLIGPGGSLGVIGLVAPGIRAFSRNADLPALQQVADIAVYAISRSIEYARDRRLADELACSLELQALLAPLFPSDGKSVKRDLIQQIRAVVGEKILGWATTYTHAEHGAFALAEVTEGQQTYLVMRDQMTNAPVNTAVGTRWLATEGVSGSAYTDRETKPIQDISKLLEGREYLPYFPAARSEVAAPLSIGQTALGVLDVESNTVHHFTSDYIDWIEFLAQLAAFALSVIDRAVKTSIEMTLAELSNEVDRSIRELDALSDFTLLRKKRNATILSIIEQMNDLIGCWVGRFTVALNAYTASGAVDRERGRLSYLVSTDHRETPDEITSREEHTFSFDKGVSSAAFLERRIIVFNDKETRDQTSWFDSDPTRQSLSGIFLPVAEGTQVVGVLNLEGGVEGTFTEDVKHACQTAADLISKMMTATRLKVLAVLREKLRDFETTILQTQSANLGDFMRRALQDAAELSDIQAGWGTVMLTWAAQDDKPFVEKLYWRAYNKSGEESFREYVYDDTPLPVVYPLFLEALRSQQPVLILDRTDEPIREREGEPWPIEARSLVCVPLLRPVEGGAEGEIESFGVLALAHPNVAEFSDFDKEILTMFAETLVGGINAVALIQARNDLIRQMRHDIAIALSPLGDELDGANDIWEKIERANDIAERRMGLDEAQQLTEDIGDLIKLISDLSTWFLDLSNDELQPPVTTNNTAAYERQTAQTILQVFRAPIHTFASAFAKTLQWNVPNEKLQPIYLEAGAERGRLIRAALFQYIDNAIKYADPDSPILIRLKQEANQVIFEVASAGLPIPERDRERIFRPNVQGEAARQLRLSALALSAPSEGDRQTPHDAGQGNEIQRRQLRKLLNSGGLGLFQVRSIAKRLGGRAYYRPDADTPTLQNVFCLALPAVTSA